MPDNQETRKCPSCKTPVPSDKDTCPKCKTPFGKVPEENMSEKESKILEERLRSLGYL